MMSLWPKRERQLPELISEKEAQYRLYGDKVAIELESIEKELEKAKRKVYHHKHSRFFNFKNVFIYAFIPIICLLAILFIGSKFINSIKNVANKPESVNPVREFRSLTVCSVGGFKPLAALIGNNRRLKSVAFSNGVKLESAIKYTIQVATYKNKKDAEVFTRQLKSFGYPAFLDIYYSRKKVVMYTVCAGPINNKKDAKDLLEKIKKEKGASGSFFK